MPSMSCPGGRWAWKWWASAGRSARSSRCHCSTSSSALARASTDGTLDKVRRMPDALIYADTFRSPELRHEVPLGVPDPILYAEKDGTKHIITPSMEAVRLAELNLYELHLMDELGIDELRKAGLGMPAIRAELALRGANAIGVTSAVVPETFPLWLADHLRANGIELSVDKDFFDDRRRAK